MSGAGLSKDVQAGFTLVELLIVIAITGMLTALAVSGFRTINSGWHRVSAHGEVAETKAAMKSFLKTLLSQCYPFRSLGSDGRQALSFKGNAVEMDFLGPLPQRFGTDDIVQYRLRFTPTHALTLGWRFDRHYADAPGTRQWSEEVLAIGSLQPSFFYFGATDKHDDARWQKSWNKSDAMPQLIDIRLSPERPEDDIIVAPAITAIFCDNASRSLCPS